MIATALDRFAAPPCVTLPATATTNAQLVEAGKALQ